MSREPAEINNRDIPALADIRRVMQEIQMLEERIHWQEEKMQSISARRMKNTPGGSRTPRGLDEPFAALSELNDEDRKLCKSYVLQVRKTKRIIENIESQSMRTFVRLKYVCQEPDTRIMKSLHMSKRGFYRAKRCVEEAPCMAAVKWQERYILQEDLPAGAENKDNKTEHIQNTKL